MEVWTIWLIIAGFFAILEIITEGFLVLWIAIGALLAMIFSFFFPEMVTAQVILWALSSAILILSTKKLTAKIVPKTTPTNVYSVIGKRAIVVQEINIDKSSGQVKVDGDLWSAKSENSEEVIPVDSHVEVLRVEGVKVVVKKI